MVEAAVMDEKQQQKARGMIRDLLEQLLKRRRREGRSKARTRSQTPEIQTVVEAGEVHDLVGRVVGKRHTEQQSREKNHAERRTAG